MKSKDIWDNRKTSEKAYQEHQVFASLDKFIDFYRIFSDSIMSFPKSGTTSIINIDSYIYSSIEGTIESISTILKNGRIGDAFTLLRKYHDSIIMDIYINLYLEENIDTEKFIVKEITDWLTGNEQLPDYRRMSQYIRKSEKLKSVTDMLYRDDRYKETRDRCNDHTHYNYYDNFIVNDSEAHIKNRIDLLNTFHQDVVNILVLHLSYIFFLNDHYMSSSDYLGNLEMRITPEEDSQYWVAPFIQEMFDNVITKERPDITALIKQNSCMQLSDD